MPESKFEFMPFAVIKVRTAFPDALENITEFPLSTFAYSEFSHADRRAQQFAEQVRKGLTVPEEACNLEYVVSLGNGSFIATEVRQREKWD
jgi:hypothetical protein